eukprot:g36719.t1
MGPEQTCFFEVYACRVPKASMHQVLFSDHSLLWAELVPFSARTRLAYWAIIILLPKKGNLRLVSHLSTDYKIFARALSTHLGAVLDQMSQADQSYIVPTQSVHDNIHLVWDMIHYSQRAVHGLHYDTQFLFVEWSQLQAFFQLLGRAKMAINRSKQWTEEELVVPDYLPLFCRYVRTRVSLEKEHAMLTSMVDAFRDCSA